MRTEVAPSRSGTLSQALSVAVHPWPSERVTLAFFSYLAVLGFLRDTPVVHRTALVAMPLLIWLGLWFESHHSKPWTRVLRQWCAMGLILVGYWSIEVFSTPFKLEHLQTLWAQWDRILLFQWGLRNAIEAAGPLIPFLLEAAYLSLYTIPVVALTLLYFTARPADRRQFQLTLFLGTYGAYAMLPLVAVESPRKVFPNEDEPTVVTAPRRINTWMLDRLDISTGVFPSGHVAVAFSTAFGLWIALRRRRFIWMSAFAVASLVYLATIHGRYHYAVDGLASIAIAAAASRVSRVWSESYES
jgi:membrane-associated phospholipid phosphatase